MTRGGFPGEEWRMTYLEFVPSSFTLSKQREGLVEEVVVEVETSPRREYVRGGGGRGNRR